MKYKTVVIDFPYTVDNFRGTHHSINLKNGLPYKMMKDEELENFPINDFADEQCSLFLWTIQGKLEFTINLLKKWGFKYHCVIVWNKTKGIVVSGFNRITEFIVFGYRGKYDIKQKGTSMPTMFTEKSTKHSKKPNMFYDMLLNNTNTPRIDIFARTRHEGFESWGDEVETMRRVMMEDSQ